MGISTVPWTAHGLPAGYPWAAHGYIVLSHGLPTVGRLIGRPHESPMRHTRVHIQQYSVLSHAYIPGRLRAGPWVLVVLAGDLSALLAVQVQYQVLC